MGVACSGTGPSLLEGLAKSGVTPPLNVKFSESVHIQGHGACYHGGAHSFS